MRSRAPEHCQIPFGLSLVEAQNVQVASAAFDFKIAIVVAMPLIDIFDDVDLTVVEMKPAGHFDAATVGIGLGPNPHRCARCRRNLGETRQQKPAVRVDIDQMSTSAATQLAQPGMGCDLTGWRASISTTSVSETWVKSE
jgi:hypothetical protein